MTTSVFVLVTLSLLFHITISCQVPPELRNGRVLHCSPLLPPVPGRTCHFRCNQGFVLEGPRYMHCRNDGKLRSEDGKEEFPVCKAVPQRIQETPNRYNHMNYTRRRTHTFTIPRTNPCTIQNGGCEYTCMNLNGQARCKCPKGFALNDDKKHCKDIDECAEETLNLCNQVCINTEGSYNCSCLPGYVQINKYKCEGCRKNSYWSPEDNACLDCPVDSFTDSEAKTSIQDCKCKPGFTGDPSKNIPCEDINECAIDNFGCSHECVNLPGSAFCSCSVGYAVGNDNKTCVDIDECSLKNGGCEGSCVNIEGDFYCTCPKGYTRSNKDRYSCDDVDECLINNGDCQQICNNYGGGYYCSCEDGFRLDIEQKKCIRIECPSVPLPNYSILKCEKDGQKLQLSHSYPLGTSCKFTCHRGFKRIQTENTIHCQNNGEWNGIVPQCTALYCPSLPAPENGDVHPLKCAKQGSAVKGRCTFTCRAGYILSGKPVFKCTNNLTWSVSEYPHCKKSIHSFLVCPDDITAILAPGANKHNITISKPRTNLENYSISPPWVIEETPVEFPAGKTKVIFSSTKPNTNVTKKCTVNVNVIDEEPPVFDYCPDSIEIEGNSILGVYVSWREPSVTDNVEVISLTSSMEPGTVLMPGTYFVEYTAKDKEGNIAICSFDINVTYSQCSDLSDPAHGRANCMHWLFGNICNPSCDLGFMRNPSDPQLYACDDSRVWQPTDVITDCLEYIAKSSTTCPPGYKVEMNDEINQEVCMKIP